MQGSWRSEAVNRNVGGMFRRKVPLMEDEGLSQFSRCNSPSSMTQDSSDDSSIKNQPIRNYRPRVRVIRPLRKTGSRDGKTRIAFVSTGLERSRLAQFFNNEQQKCLNERKREMRITSQMKMNDRCWMLNISKIQSCCSPNKDVRDC